MKHKTHGKHRMPSGKMMANKDMPHEYGAGVTKRKKRKKAKY